MRAPDDIEVAAWLAKAASDLRMADFAAEKKVSLWDQVCFRRDFVAESSTPFCLPRGFNPHPLGDYRRQRPFSLREKGKSYWRIVRG